ncbi:hypothetical protein [Halocatena marina]|nr:hypothetical protein [Halocatena marina]
MSVERSSQRCELHAAADLLATLDERLIEHLTVDDSRTFVLYNEAILDLTVSDGDLCAARSFTIGLQGFAQRVSDPDPESVITALCRDLTASIDTKQR